MHLAIKYTFSTVTYEYVHVYTIISNQLEVARKKLQQALQKYIEEGRH